MAKQIAAKDVAELRQRTGAGMMECKKALQETSGDMQQAEIWLRKKGIAKAEKRAGRTASEGVIGSYVHHDHKTAVLVELNCETDFVARTEDFRNLAREIAIHVASANPIAVSTDGVPEDVVAKERTIFEAQAKESGKPEAVWPKIVEGRIKKFYQEHVLLEQPFVRDDKITVQDLVNHVAAKVGENVVVRRFARFKVGEE